jgi:hypothetical protein
MSKAPKKLSNCLKRTETSVVLIVFDCVLCEVRAYKRISINAVTVSYRRSTWIRYQKTISWSITKYNKKYPVNATAQIEQVQDKKTSNRTAKKYYLNILCFNLVITLILFVLASDNLIGTFILYCKIQECRLTVETTKWRQASSIHLYLKCE